MSESARNGHIGRSIFAVLAGIVVGVGLTVATDAVLHRVDFFPSLGQTTPDEPLAVATAYRVVFSILGSYIIARQAPNRPMLHSMISGVIGVVVSTIGAIVTWNHVPPLGAHWYPVALIVTALPCAWIGARLYTVQSADQRERAVSEIRA